MQTDNPRADVSAIIAELQLGLSVDLAEITDTLHDELIRAALGVCNGKVTDAAKRLGLLRQTLHSMMKSRGI